MTDPDPGVLRLPDGPGLLLAGGVPLPANHPYAPMGALSLRLGDLTVTCESTPGAATFEDLGDGFGRVGYRLPVLMLSGRYSLDVHPEQQSRIDSAGDLRPLSEQPPSPGFPAPARLSDDVHEEQLNAARAERDRLIRSGDNGYQLVRSFYEHNEVFNEVFDNDYMSEWQADGITAQMAEDTHQAVKGADPINKKSYQGINGNEPVTYNFNAFTQKLSVRTGIVYLHQASPEEKYVKAGEAVDTFAQYVIGTGNTKDAVIAMTADEVREAVNHARPTAGEPPAPVDTAPYLDPDTYLERIAVEGESACPGLSASDLRHIQRARAAILRADAAAARSGVPLYQGVCRARIEGGTVTAGTVGDAATRRLGWLEVDVPAVPFELDDAAWEGEAGSTARERIAAMRFLSTLLRDSVAERVAVAARRGTAPFGHAELPAEES